MAWKVVTVEYFDEWFVPMITIAEREFLDYLQELE